MRSVTVRPILGLPAAAEGSFLADVLDVNHVDDLSFGQPYRPVNLGAWLGATLGTEGKVGHVDETTEGSGRWDEREPVLESKSEPSAEGVRDRQSGQVVGQGGLDQSGQGLHRVNTQGAMKWQKTEPGGGRGRFRTAAELCCFATQRD